MLLQSFVSRTVSAFAPSRLQAAARSAVPAVAVPINAPKSVDAEPAVPTCAAAPKRSRAEQSRINGAKSRGPKTDAGKAVARFNAFKHGLTSACVLMPGEDRTLFNAWVIDFHHELRPVGTVQESLVQRVAEIAWRLRRLPELEANILGKCSGDLNADPEQWMKGWASQILGDTNDGVLMRLQRYEVRLERSYSNCLRELRLLQQRPMDEQSDEPSEMDQVVADALAKCEETASGSFGKDVDASSGSFGTAEVVTVSDNGGMDDADAVEEMSDEENHDAFNDSDESDVEISGSFCTGRVSNRDD